MLDYAGLTGLLTSLAVILSTFNTLATGGLLNLHWFTQMLYLSIGIPVLSATSVAVYTIAGKLESKLEK